MGLELAEIFINIEDKFSIEIEEEELWFDKSQQANVDEYTDQLTVKFLCDLVERKIQEKNKGISSFPNILCRVGDSVRETLSKQFNISDPTRIVNELSLEQLADFSASPISAGFWRQLRKIRKDDADELKTIKSYLLYREYVSAFKILVLPLGITVVFSVWLWILLLKNVSNFLVILLVPIGILFGILFGIRAIVNWTRRRNRSQITVGEIIDYIVDKKRDRSVRADGLPYSREEIEQGVIKILCESLFVKPEDITMGTRLIKDLRL
jgi:acyl carrier protein